MNQGTQGYSLTKKTEGRKSRDTVSLNHPSWAPDLWAKAVSNIGSNSLTYSKITFFCMICQCHQIRAYRFIQNGQTW
jgi:hypothetical protein